MRLAVLMSSYNGEKFIARQLDSILAQEGDFTLDIIVRDDGSADTTRDILEAYADAGKLRWYTGENLKPAKSFLDLLYQNPIHLITQISGYYLWKVKINMTERGPVI